MKNYSFYLKNLDCASCGKKIEDKISSIDGYEEVNVNFSTLKLSFKTKKENNVKEEITNIIEKLEPEIEVFEYDKIKNEEDTQRNNYDIIRIIIGVLIFLIGNYLPIGRIAKIYIFTLSLVILLYRIGIKAYKQLIKNHILDENALITISSIGACIVNKTTEGIMVIVLYEIGKILEAKAVSKTRKSITNLMDIKPEYANIKQNEEIKQVDPNKVKIGDIILIKTGEKIPLDGTVIKGNAEIDNSALTGESKLIKVQEQSKVLSGAINVQGIIEVKVEKNYENSTVNQILNLVENATDKKAKTETFVAKAAKIYTPIVFVLAIIVAIFMPLVFKNITYMQSIYKALIFLVISCPCSIAISVPLSYFSGIGKASKQGILIKGSDFLDRLKNIKQILFDKTGTITTGKFCVSEINILDEKYKKEEILNYFLLGESFSNHPIAKSIIEQYKKEIETNIVTDFKEVAGKGIEYKINQDVIKIGNSAFVEKDLKEKEEGTILYLKVNQTIAGSILITDEIKKDAKQTIEKLKKLGIKTQMLTGDEKEIAIKIGKQVGMQKITANMLPQDKYKELEKVISNCNSNEMVAYVGDGINDSPVLARADIGISMGGIGSNSAIEASDIVIMTDELSKIIDAINISKKTNRIIKQNLIFAIGVKILILILSLFGISDMWEAVFADVGTTIITIFNTIRILK